MDHQSDPWDSEVVRDLAEALLASEHDALTPRELGLPSGRDASNVRAYAERMVEDGILERRAPTRPQPGQGRKARWVYGFAPGQEDRARQALEDRARAGLLRPGQTLVFAELGEADRLFAVLSDPTYTRRAQWFALEEGDPQEFVIAFDPDAAEAALTLMAVFAAAEIRCRRSYISRVGPTGRLVGQAQRTAWLAGGARRTHRTRPG